MTSTVRNASGGKTFITRQDVRAAAPANAPGDVIRWVVEIAELTTPDAIEFSSDSQEEQDRLTS